MYANYTFSITGDQQAAWQDFLRSLPKNIQRHPTWQMLHALSYTASYSAKPQHGLDSLFSVRK
jgi:hypothetical protein